MKHKMLAFAAFAVLAFAAHAYVRIPVGPVRSDRPVKVVAVEAASTNATATVVLARVADMSYGKVVSTSTVVTNGWTGDVPVLATNLVFRETKVARAVTNTVLSAACSGGFLSTNVTLFVSAGDAFLSTGTAERVVIVGE